MKKLFIQLFVVAFSLIVSFVAFAQNSPPAEAIQVEEMDAIYLFRFVGGVFTSLPEDSQNQILHSDLMMCSLFFKMGNKKMARCMLPSEQIRFDKENAVLVFDIMKKYGMPTNFKFGYETVEGALDCTNALSGKEYPKCWLTPKTLE